MQQCSNLNSAVSLLKDIIRIPSISFDEENVAQFIYNSLADRIVKGKYNIELHRVMNNLILFNKEYLENKPALILCSHIDTVKASSDYTLDPFNPIEKDGKIYGLGSNDDGGCVVTQIETFFETYNKCNNLNLILVLTAEEEKSGPNGMDIVVKYLKEINKYPQYAILGEPTQMKAALGERGLLVLDGESIGKSGHAARNEGINALYIAIDDINTLRNFKFNKVSSLMGEVKLTVTQINCGTAHNVVPDKATFVVDIRPTDVYSNIEILELLQQSVKSKLIARNLTNRTSATPLDCRLLLTIKELGIDTYISPTTSDWMRIDIPGIKMGPGDSSRSHRADEFIKIKELEEGIKGYIAFITNFNKNLS